VLPITVATPVGFARPTFAFWTIGPDGKAIMAAMNQSNSELPSVFFTGVDCLLHRLQHALGAQDQSFLLFS
jgi:hypothetical protein